MKTIAAGANGAGASLTRAAFMSAIGIGCFVLLWSSVLGGLIALTVLATTAAAPDRRGRVLVASLTITVAVFTLFKKPEADEYYYLLYIDLLRGYGAGWLSDAVFSIRSTEPLFIAFTRLVSLLPYGKLLFIALLLTSVYYMPGRALVAYSRRLNALSVPVILFAFLLSINMFGAAQLMRQYLAMSIAAVSLVYLADGRYRMAAGIVIVSAMIHNSNLMLLFPIGAAYWIQRRPLLTLGAIGFVALAGYVYFSRQQMVYLDATSSERWLSAFSKDDGSVPIWLIAADVSLLLGLVLMRLRAPRGDVILHGFTGFALALAAIMIAVSQQSLLFLRTYVAVEFVRPFVVLLLLREVRLQRDPIVGSALVLLSVAYFGFRLSNTVFDYGGTLEQIFGIGVADLAERITDFDLY